MLDDWDADVRRGVVAAAITSPPTPGHGVLVALEQNTVVGFAAFGPPELTAAEQPDPAGPTSEISTLLVEPRWGRRGHGSRLLAAVADLARAAVPPGCRSGCSRPTASPPASTSRPAGRRDGWARTLDTGGAPLREVRWHALLGSEQPTNEGTRTEGER